MLVLFLALILHEVNSHERKEGLACLNVVHVEAAVVAAGNNLAPVLRDADRPEAHRLLVVAEEREGNVPVVVAVQIAEMHNVVDRRVDDKVGRRTQIHVGDGPVNILELHRLVLGPVGRVVDLEERVLARNRAPSCANCPM